MLRGGTGSGCGSGRRVRDRLIDSRISVLDQQADEPSAAAPATGSKRNGRLAGAGDLLLHTISDLHGFASLKCETRRTSALSAGRTVMTSRLMTTSDRCRPNDVTQSTLANQHRSKWPTSLTTPRSPAAFHA